MTAAKTMGRRIGALVLLQLVGLSVPFMLLMPGVGPDFLEVAAGLDGRIRLVAILLLANAALTLCISLIALPLARPHGEGAALGLVAVSVVWLVMQAVDNACILSMLSLSERYRADAPSGTGWLAIADTLRATRRWVHYSALLAIEGWFLTFYAILFRSAMVPRALAAFGIAMVFVHAAAITLPVFVGYAGIPLLGMSLAASHLAVVGRLLVKGLETKESAGRRLAWSAPATP